MTVHPLTVVVLTFNEEKNLDTCLSSVRGWAGDLVVVDSGSTDGTLEIARRHGARVLEHAFETHAAQWAWAIEHADLSAPWVLGLDADQSVTPSLRQAIDIFLRSPGDAVGAYVRRRQVFRGKWIRFGGYYPKYLLKLFRRDEVSLDQAELVDHHFHVRGRTVRLAGDLIEANRNEDDLEVWLTKHMRYARLQARQDARTAEERRPTRLFGTPDERTRWMKAQWARLPLFARPTLYFIWRYLFRLGFLDGREGFVFHFLQAYWYRVLVDVHTSVLATSESRSSSSRTSQASPEASAERAQGSGRAPRSGASA